MISINDNRHNDANSNNNAMKKKHGYNDEVNYKCIYYYFTNELTSVYDP